MHTQALTSRVLSEVDCYLHVLVLGLRNQLLQPSLHMCQRIEISTLHMCVRTWSDCVCLRVRLCVWCTRYTNMQIFQGECEYICICECVCACTSRIRIHATHTRRHTHTHAHPPSPSHSPSLPFALFIISCSSPVFSPSSPFSSFCPSSLHPIHHLHFRPTLGAATTADAPGSGVLVNTVLMCCHFLANSVLLH